LEDGRGLAERGKEETFGKEGAGGVAAAPMSSPAVEPASAATHVHNPVAFTADFRVEETMHRVGNEHG